MCIAEHDIPRLGAKCRTLTCEGITTKYIRVENKIQEALKELYKSTKPNVTEAARRHGVPKSRLRAR